MTPHPPGTQLDGKWILDEVLGEGGMGVVYAARHARNGLAVAIKVLHPGADENTRARFLKEGYAANRVEHLGTVRVLDDGQTAQGVVYLVMERLFGASLEALAERAGGRLPIARVLPAARAVAAVLAAAHARNIVHRDIKPENVFVCNDGAIKVLDFGIARVRDADSGRRTTQDAVLGTPAFMAPEQALGHSERVGPPSDVYALAASVFNLLTGELLHEGRTASELLVKVCTTPAPPVRSLAPWIPESLAQVLDRALRFSPEERYVDGKALEEALALVTIDPLFVTPPPRRSGEPRAAPDGSWDHATVANAPSRSTASAMSSSNRRTSTPTSRWVALFAVLGVAGGVAAFVWLRPTSTPTPASMEATDPAPPNEPSTANGAVVAPSHASVTVSPPIPTVEPAISASASAANSVSASPTPSASPPAKPPAKLPGKAPPKGGTTTTNPLDRFE